MKTPLEHLRNLSKAHRDRVKKAQTIAEKMKRVADAAAAATLEGESEAE